MCELHSRSANSFGWQFKNLSFDTLEIKYLNWPSVNGSFKLVWEDLQKDFFEAKYGLTCHSKGNLTDESPSLWVPSLWVPSLWENGNQTR